MKNRRGWKYAIAITIVVLAFYGILYFFPEIFSFELSCADKGGICRDSCGFWETQDGNCDARPCCVPYEEGIEQARLAVKQRNSLFCSSIESADAKTACEIAVLDANALDFAVKYKNANYCNDIKDSSMKDSCFMEIASLSSSIGLCQKILSSSARDKCHLSFVKTADDWKICIEMLESEFSEESCIKSVALIAKNPEMCSQITFASEMYDCYLKAELEKNMPIEARCTGLSENNCINAKGCKPIIITEAIDNVLNAYGGCTRDMKMLCGLTGGKWEYVSGGVFNDMFEKCVCPSPKILFDEYGCYECGIFKTEYAKQECKKRSD